MQKAGLFAVFSLGIFIVGVAIARVVVTDTRTRHPEVSWLALWSAVESSVAVIVCCLASFKVLFKPDPTNSRSQPYYASNSRARTGRDAEHGATAHELTGDRVPKLCSSVAIVQVRAGDKLTPWDPRTSESSSQVEILGDVAGMGNYKLDRIRR